MIYYDMFIEVMRTGLVQYDLVKFDTSIENDFGTEISTAADSPRTWEHVIEDIEIFQPKTIKINPIWKGFSEK